MTELFPSNHEWNYVLFKIQVILGNPSVEILSIIKHHTNFSQQHQFHMKVDAAIEASSYSQKDLEYLKYGNQSKYIFEAGHISLPPQGQRLSSKKTMLLFKLAINETMPIHKSGLPQLTDLTEFPPEIDTIYVSDSKEELNIYPHKFKVKNKSQVCLQYEVEYAIKGLQSIRKWKKQKITCQYCENEVACYYCPEDKQLYCAKCYQNAHRNHKKVHKKQEVSPYNSSKYCTFHPNQKLNFYCFQCRQIRCEKCLQNQLNKPGNKHKDNISLIELGEKLKEKEKMFLDQAKSKTKSLMLKVETKMKSLGKFYEIKQKELEEEFTAKLIKIREQSNKNIEKCLAVHSELKRKLDQFLWLENYMTYCESFMLADDSIKMKEAFSEYLERLTSKEYYQVLQKKIDDSSAPPKQF